MAASSAPSSPGRAIVIAAWTTNVVFAAVVVPDALGLTFVGGLADALCVGLFLGSLPVWVWAFGHAVVRSTRGDEIVVANLFFLQGSAPRPVRRHLLGALGVSVLVAVVVMFANPLATLVPMLPLGLAGLWGARHGTFPPRRDTRGRRSR